MGTSEKQRSNWISYGKERWGEISVKREGQKVRYAFWYDASLTSLKERVKEGRWGNKSQMIAWFQERLMEAGGRVFTRAKVASPCKNGLANLKFLAGSGLKERVFSLKMMGCQLNRWQQCI